MDAELKRKWVEALRSGEYAQTQHGCLRYEDSYCCLGVLADVLGTTWTRHNEYRSRFVPSTEVRSKESNASDCHLDDAVYARIGLLDDEETFGNSSAARLARMNDSGADFTLIADYIEKHL